MDKGFAAEVVGVDGNEESGLRPCSGFKKVYELSFLPATNHDLTSVVLDFYPVQFSIGSRGYAYGFVYRVRRAVSTGATVADIFLDYWNSNTGAWSTGNLVAGTVDPDEPWSRVAWGRFVFIFVRGRGAAMFYVNPTNQALVQLGDDVVGPFPGPGKRPHLNSPEIATNLGSFNPSLETERPGYGQVVLVTVLPSSSYLYPGPCGGYNHSVSTSSSSGSNADCDCDPPSDADPRKLESGDYTFAYQLVDSATGRKSALSQVAQAREADFSLLSSTGSDSGSGDDTYAYRDKYAVLELVYDSEKYDQAYVYRSVKVQDAGGTFVAAVLLLDKIVDLECHQTNRNGTGEDYDPASTSMRHAAYWYELEDKQLPYQDAYIEKPLFDEAVPRAGTAIMYENTLLATDIASPPLSTEDGNRTGDIQRGLGEIRWSALSEGQPELFAPSSRYVPSVPSTRILRFQPAGSNIMGFSSGRQFFLRKDSTAIRVVETHKGFGITGAHAAETIGSTIYICTFKGVKTVDASTQLDDIRALNYIVMKEWSPSSLERVSMGFDPAVSALFVFNPDYKKAAVIWFNPARVTELWDLPFIQVQPGVWPVEPLEYDSTLDERVLWLQEYPREENEAAPTGWKPRIFLFDANRTKTIGTGPYAGDPRVTTLDFPGDSRFALEDSFFNSTFIRLSLAGGLTSPGSGVEGSFLYVIQSNDPLLVGKKCQIKKVSSVTVDYVELELANDQAGDLYGLVEGDRVAVSPVYTGWIGSPLAILTPDGMDYGGQGFFRIRHVDSVGASFTQVQGPPTEDATSDAKFLAVVYKGDEATPSGKGLARAVGTGTQIRSVLEGASSNYAAIGSSGWAATSTDGKWGIDGTVLCPGLFTICPDLDYRLMAAMVNGEVRANARPQRAS